MTGLLFAAEVDAPDLPSLERRVRQAEDAGYTFVTFPDDPLRGGVEAGVLAAFLARRTTRIGLAPTLHTSTTEPFHLATQLASLDHASLGRAGWVVGATSDPAALATVGRGEVDPAEVADVVEVARGLWDSWEDDAVIKDVATGRFLDPARVHHVHFESDRFSIVGPLITPRPPQGQVVVIGSAALGVTGQLDVVLADPAHGRPDGAALAFASVPASYDLDSLPECFDGVHILGGGLPPVRRRATGTTLRILPGASVVLGDTEAEARERARWIKREQTTGPRALAYLEQFWGKDLSGYDPDGPLPDIDPTGDELDPSRGTLPIEFRSGKLARIAAWRELAEARNLSIRDLVIEVSPGHDAFVGTPGQVADEWARFVRDGVVDGFNLLPQLLPGTVEDVVDRLVPQLQERGVYRTAYTGTTLRDHLSLSL